MRTTSQLRQCPRGLDIVTKNRRVNVLAVWDGHGHMGMPVTWQDWRHMMIKISRRRLQFNVEKLGCEGDDDESDDDDSDNEAIFDYDGPQ
ncbi:hypothetical protein Dda_0690 [Drechslerella dactyloides]|uniref:Uncharacterized protein n=1 Tax=Drechslerella dactyloides TaxID=74499 RepID=A0AAD6J4X5_DREDA|nr:hypothetical protein Dda_0690 [Drechslerella dactyloides]